MMRRIVLCLAGGAALFLLSCGGSNTDTANHPKNVCVSGDSVEIGMMCIQGSWDFNDNSMHLTPDSPLDIVLYPKGCYSSSCTIVYDASCSVARNGSLNVTGKFCLANSARPDSACTADCSGGGFARCTTGTLEPGDYTAIAGDLKLAFTVPSVVGYSKCVGSAF